LGTVVTGLLVTELIGWVCVACLIGLVAGALLGPILEASWDIWRALRGKR
jgi:hypothetical protein